MSMLPGVVFIVFSFVLIASDVEGKLSFQSIIDLISPRDPDVHRVRRIEDANGDPWAVLDTVGLIEQHGYMAEQHNFTSDDGYNIVIFRMPGSPTSPPAKGKLVVYMQHGMLASSDSWALMSPETDLVYMLADAGYDVWIGNVRGNTYCRSHTSLTTAQKEFWDFSFHEAALMDVAGGISYALKYTGEKKLLYIGHSMGTTMSLVLLSQRPEFNEKMRLVVNLAPTAYWKFQSNIMYQLAVQYSDVIRKVLVDGLGIHHLFAQSKNNAMMVKMFCSEGSPMLAMCLTMFGLATGEPIEALNISMLSSLAKYFPAGVSTKTLVHFAQCLKTGDLQEYDYGRGKNLKLYGTAKPPVYDFSVISAPVALIYGKTDELSLEPNVIGLSKLLPNLATCEAVPAPVFNHMDFIVSKYAKELVYNRILELFSLYTE